LIRSGLRYRLPVQSSVFAWPDRRTFVILGKSFLSAAVFSWPSPQRTNLACHWRPAIGKQRQAVRVSERATVSMWRIRVISICCRSQHKRSKNPGDSTEMIQARTAFLIGRLCAIADQLNVSRMYCSRAARGAELCLLGCRCGGGYYLAAISVAENSHKSKTDA